MKHLLQILFLFFSCFIFSQNQVIQIASAETVLFSASTSGCFNAGANTYKFVKQKNKAYKIVCTIDKKTGTKKLSAKNYEAFVKRFEESAERFKDPDEKQLCTTTSTFELSSKKGNLKFVNGTCQPEFNPEEYLMQLLK